MEKQDWVGDNRLSGQIMTRLSSLASFTLKSQANALRNQNHCSR